MTRHLRLGPWRVVRCLGRDLSGVYYAGYRGEHERATLYLPSGDVVATRSHSLRQLLERHRSVVHAGLVGFRGLDHDDDGAPFLVADPVDDAMTSLRSGQRPTAGQTRAVGAALAAALAAAHDSGLVHGGLELDNTLWAPGKAPRILGVGVAVASIADSPALARGDVVGLGRLLCALVASWTPRYPDHASSTADNRTVELVRLLADPGAAISMREAYTLFAADDQRLPTVRASGGSAAVAEAPDQHLPYGRRDERADLLLAAAPTEDYVLASTSNAGSRGCLDAEGSDTQVTCAVESRTGDAATGAALAPHQSHDLGRQLGRYRVLARLGCGGMGEVFLAEDPTLRRGVAIKRIRPGLERDRSFRARLRREAQLAAQLNHRAIVQVFDLITENDIDHVVMEYVPGPSLHALLAGSPMPVTEALRIAAEIADGLACAHQRGVVHRDLKLENVLISIDGQPKIADFGLARRTAGSADASASGGSLTRDGYVMGTSRVMSPEQVQGQDTDARSDLFSFGVMMYELVTGRSPFASDTDAQTFVRVLGERQLPAHALTPDLPRALSELIDHLLEKDPKRRPDSALTVRDRLRQLVDAPRDLATAGHAIAGPVQGGADADEWDTAKPADANEANHLPDSSTRVASARGGVSLANDPGAGRYPSAPRTLKAKIQAPFVLAEIRALRGSIFKRSPEIQTALAIADKIEQSYNLRRTDLFIPALDTFCAILEPFATGMLTGTVRRVGYEIFPQFISILGIPASNARIAMDLKHGTDLVRLVCDSYKKCVIGTDSGTLTSIVAGSTATVTDTTFMPCQLQMGVFLGAGKLTGLFPDTALTETRCRARGDSACVYEFAF